MLKPPDIVESVEIALADLVKFRRRILKRLKPNEKEAVLEAFGELSQYAATVEDHADLMALSEVIYRIIDGTPILRGFLPLKVSNIPKTRDVPLSLDEEVQKQSMDSNFVSRSAANMRNQLTVIITGDKLLPPEPPPSATAPDRSSWLSQILKRFRQIGVPSS